MPRVSSMHDVSKSFNTVEEPQIILSHRTPSHAAPCQPTSTLCETSSMTDLTSECIAKLTSKLKRVEGQLVAENEANDDLTE